MRKLSEASGKLSSEFDLIARLSAGIHLSRSTILGVGDDCAIVARPHGQLLFTIDSMVENVHFDRRWGTPEMLGARALAVNLSDIAAMGGRPTACVVNLGVREGIASRTLERIYSGLRAAAREASTDIVGGNITRARELSITIALIGEAGRRAMRRDTARPGDEIFVTGMLGDAALGWRLLAGKLKARGEAKNNRAAKNIWSSDSSVRMRGSMPGNVSRRCGPRRPRSTSATDSSRTSGTSSSAVASAPRSTRRKYRSRQPIER